MATDTSKMSVSSTDVGGLRRLNAVLPYYNTLHETNNFADLGGHRLRWYNIDANYRTLPVFAVAHTVFNGDSCIIDGKVFDINLSGSRGAYCPSLKKIHHGCLCCGGTEQLASLETPVFADDGTITKDGVIVYPDAETMTIPNEDGKDWIVAKKRVDPAFDFQPLKVFEEMALKEPDADWRFTFVKALRDGEYQRQGEGKWVLIRSGQGYA